MLWQSSRVLIGQWNHHPMQLGDFEANLRIAAHRAGFMEGHEASRTLRGRNLHSRVLTIGMR
jgi:hypothetical protein